MSASSDTFTRAQGEPVVSIRYVVCLRDNSVRPACHRRPSLRSASSTYRCGYAFVGGPGEERRCRRMAHRHLADRPPVDCLDLDRSAGFWGPLLGLQPAGRLDNYLFMGSVLPGCDLVLQRVESVTTDKSPIHFDVGGSKPGDFHKVVARAERLGGTIVATVEEAEYTLAVMIDPDGNEFCVNLVASVPAAAGLG